MVEADLGKGPTLVGINTQHPNKLVAEAIEAGTIKGLAGYASLKREQKTERIPGSICCWKIRRRIAAPMSK